MTLSEAIRIGSKIRPQCTGKFFYREQSCALGAAYEAYIGSDQVEISYSTVIKEVFPSATMKVPRCPANSLCGMDGVVNSGINFSVMDVIMHLNDNHGWTRERIADWVQSIEER